MPRHIALAKNAGASRGEIISAVLVGLPAAEAAVLQALPLAIKAYDERYLRGEQ